MIRNSEREYHLKHHSVMFQEPGADISLVEFDNGFGDGQPQSVAAVRGSGFIGPVEPLKDFIKITVGGGAAVIDHL